MIQFQPWMPDYAAFDTPASQTMQNVIPSISGYRPFPAFGNVASALSARVRGAVTARSIAGVIANFCGTDTKLYKLASNGASWSDVTRAVGGDHSLGGDGWWSFITFGNYVIGASISEDTQYYDMTSSTNFAKLSVSAPKAAFPGVVRDFAILARTSSNYNEIQWCAINDPTDWTPSTTTMADYQQFPDGGSIMGFVGGEYGIVFQERAIQRMSFEGPPLIFRFDKVSNTLGCRAEKSIAAYGDLAFFLSDDGFYMLQGGAQLQPIGAGKVDKWFESDVNSSYLYRMSSGIDPINKLYVLSYCSGGNSDPDSLLLYHWPTSQWALVRTSHELIFSGAVQSSYTIDTMNTVSSTIDGLTYPVDSRFWTGTGRILLAGFDQSHRHGYFNGVNLEATIETGDTQMSPGQKSLLKGLRPMIEGTSVTPTVTVGYRNRLQDSVTFTSPVTVNDYGYATFRVNARYHRAKVVVPASSTWTLATGLDDVKFSPMGAR